MSIRFEGLAFGGYRSFGGPIARLAPLSKLNFLIGANNSGKSNILKVIETSLPSESKQPNRVGFSVSGLNLPQTGDTTSRTQIGVRITSDKLQTIAARIRDPHTLRNFQLFIESPPLSLQTEMIWFRYLGNRFDESIVKELQDYFYQQFTDDDWELLAHAVTNGAFSVRHNPEGNISTILKDFIRLFEIEASVNVHSIPDLRRIDSSASEFNPSGAGVIKYLAGLQNPSFQDPAKYRQSKEKFSQINMFVKSVTGNGSAQLEIASNQLEISVHLDGKVLPLDHMGRGIHQVVLMASAVTQWEKSIVCIEEPEIHLHPGLLRALLEFLSKQTDNQYFITTHASQALDIADSSVFHVRIDSNGHSEVEHADTAKAKSSICRILGHRPSDLMQANCVIWVEGPSDRIYLRHWLNALDPSLTYGLHYSVMTYGGKLLSHFTANELTNIENAQGAELSSTEPVSDFISLRRLNSYGVIVIDRDKSSATEPINETKLRVQGEFDRGPGFAWISAGREIENYIEPKLLDSAARKVHGEETELPNIGKPFERALTMKVDGGKKQADKVAIARVVTQAPADLSILDLQSQLERLVRFIRVSNGI